MTTATVTAFNAKQKLSALLALTTVGQAFVITRHGIPVARLIPFHETQQPKEGKDG